MVRFKQLLRASRRIPFVLFLLFVTACNQSHKKHDHPVEMDRLILKVWRIADQHKQKESYRYLDSAFAEISNPGIGDHWKVYYFKQTICLFEGRSTNNLKQIKMSLIYADRLLYLIEVNHAEKTYKKEYSIANITKGDALFELGRYDESYQYYFKGKMLAEKSRTPCNNAFFDNRLGLINFKQGKFREAASLFIQNYKDQQSCKQDFVGFGVIQGALDNAGESYYHAGMPDSAIVYYQLALHYIRDKGVLYPLRNRFVKDATGVVYGNLADVYAERGQLADAEKFFKMSISLNSLQGNEQRTSQNVQLKLARLYLEDGRMKESDHLLSTIRLSLDTLNNEGAELGWNKLKWNYYSAQGQIEKSNPYLLAYLKLKDSADLKNIKLHIADAGSSFKNIQQKYDIAILKKETELRTLYLIVTITFSSMFLVIILQVWRNWQSSNAKNKDLTLLNEKIVRQHRSTTNALSALEESQKENTKIMSVVAHDLRNPIGSMTSLATLMMEDPHSEDDRKMLEMIRTSGINSLALVNDLLQKKSQEEDLKREAVDLYSMLNYCVGLLHFKAEEKKQQVDLTAEHIICMVNRQKMWRVISNLIANAIKFSPGGAIIQVNLSDGNGRVLIAVKDSGIGIPENLKDKIFDVFSEAKRHGTAGEQPFGLGLAISRQIVEAHNGKIWFESVENEGTTFFVDLPLVEPVS